MTLAAELLQKEFSEVVIRGLRNATQKVIMVVDILTKRLPGITVSWDTNLLEMQEGQPEGKIFSRKLPLLVATLVAS